MVPHWKGFDWTGTSPGDRSLYEGARSIERFYIARHDALILRLGTSTTFLTVTTSH